MTKQQQIDELMSETYYRLKKSYTIAARLGRFIKDISIHVVRDRGVSDDS